ncbi:MAG: M23 family metallopeptidase [Myxococcaceae bacterium]
MALPLIPSVLLLATFGASPFEVRIQPSSLKPGDPLRIELLAGAAGTPERLPFGTLGPRPLRFHATRTGYEALAALPIETEPGKLELRISSGPGEKPSAHTTLTVLDAKYPARELKVAQEFIEPPEEVRQRIAEDQKAFDEAYAQPFSPRAFVGPFVRPRHSSVTAPYGDRRLFNGAQQSQHYGMDLDGRVGDPVLAAHRGTVVLARDCYASGKTVLVHHGADVFTAYFHLSKIRVKMGEQVAQRQRLGDVGKTGRVTGPHLHWGVRIGGLYVDPAVLLRITFPKR